LDVVGGMIDKNNLNGAVDKLEDDILIKMDGYFNGDPSDDWIITEEAQKQVYPKVLELIDLLKNSLPKEEIEPIKEIIPEYFDMKQNYPNPFNSYTTIKYQLPEQSRVNLEIYNILGSKIETLVDKEQSAGFYEVSWYADKYSTGIYFMKIKAGDYIETKKIMLLK